jgi:FkbM family methyltransferase
VTSARPCEEPFRHITQQRVITLGLDRDYEHEQLEHFGNALREAKRFLDIGANRGLYAFLANCVIRNGYIALVEPNPELAEILRREVSTWPDNNNKIEVFSVAAADTSAKMLFLIDESDDTLGRLATASSEGIRHTQVQCEPLDKLFAPADGTLLKIDVEGFEYRAILGAKRLLSAGARVILELHFWGDGKKFPIHVLWLLFSLGFAISRIGTSYSYDVMRAGFFKRCLSLMRWGPPFALRYLVRRTGLRPIMYRVLWPDLAIRAAK